jgi:hypothetical protein
MLAILFLGLLLANLVTGVRLLRLQRDFQGARQQEMAERARLLAINEQLLRAVEQARLETSEAGLGRVAAEPIAAPAP